MKDNIYKILPNFFQHTLVSLFNIIANKQRYGGRYSYFLKKFEENNNLSLNELKILQAQSFKDFVAYARENSKFYNYIPQGFVIEDLRTLPIVNKEILRKSLNDVYTIPKNKGIISKTGGTTGKSLEVVFTKENMQERFAMLDHFRGQFGYEIGKKTAWFSGKNILTSRDIKKNRFWKTDYIYNVRYYSTFHIKSSYLSYYIENLIKYSPEYIVGFPSNILEIATYGIANNLDFPKGMIKAIFPTAETVTAHSRAIIESYFGCGVYDQYASSEGAPFIIECKNKNLHLEIQSGVFEVLDANDQPTNSGRLVVTSFTTYGTPLIRFDIGDSITLSSEVCNCGNNNPLVKEILGRIDDYVYSPQMGKINLGNVSNTLKGTKGIVKFQALQDELEKIVVKVVIDKSEFTKKSEVAFIQNWKDRIGTEMEFTIAYVDDIEVESSGKFRIVKNNIKHLLK